MSPYDQKTVLADYIYQLHKRLPFYGKSALWSDPVCSFSASTKETLAQKHPKLISALKETKMIREGTDDLICVLSDWSTVAEGLFFTSKALYVQSPKNETKKFRVRYDDITEMIYYSALNQLTIIDYDSSHFYLTTKLWNIHTVKLFLDFASGLSTYSDDEMQIVNGIVLPHCDDRPASNFIPGTIFGNVSNASTIYGEEKFHATRGHGFAAERANTLFDKATGHQTTILGDDNALNGPDRIVDGVFIQSKYCKTGGRCIAECFKDGKFRYFNPDGTPMQIEVPSDKYEAAVQAMRDRISKGEVTGITDPDDASKIVRKGHFTYDQAKNIAKAGTIESISYDAANGAIIATSAFGLTSVVTFALSIWNGEDIDVALESAAYSGLKVGGVTFFSAILAGQLTKAGLNSALVKGSESFVRLMGSDASAALAYALNGGKKIFGAAAMKNTAKILRSNVITSVASIIVLSTGDVVNIFRKRISGAQLFKNVANTASSVAGGSAGYIVGSLVGGPVVGGLIGAFVGGSLTGSASSSVLSKFIEDDANKMVQIIENQFVALVPQYLLNQREVEHIIDHLGESLTGNDLKCMYASDDKEGFARSLIIPFIDREIQRRPKITALTDESMYRGIQLLVADASESQEAPQSI